MPLRVCCCDDDICPEIPSNGLGDSGGCSSFCKTINVTFRGMTNCGDDTCQSLIGDASYKGVHEFDEFKNDVTYSLAPDVENSSGGTCVYKGEGNAGLTIIPTSFLTIYPSEDCTPPVSQTHTIWSWEIVGEVNTTTQNVTITVKYYDRNGVFIFEAFRAVGLFDVYNDNQHAACNEQASFWSQGSCKVCCETCDCDDPQDQLSFSQWEEHPLSFTSNGFLFCPVHPCATQATVTVAATTGVVDPGCVSAECENLCVGTHVLTADSESFARYSKHVGDCSGPFGPISMFVTLWYRPNPKFGIGGPPFGDISIFCHPGVIGAENTLVGKWVAIPELYGSFDCYKSLGNSQIGVGIGNNSICWHNVTAHSFEIQHQPCCYEYDGDDIIALREGTPDSLGVCEDGGI